MNNKFAFEHIWLVNTYKGCEVMRYLDGGIRVFEFWYMLQKQWKWCLCMDGWHSTNLQALVLAC